MRAQLLDQLNRLVCDELSLHTFEAWPVGNLQAIFDSGDAVAIHIANEADADLVQLGEGLIDIRTLFEQFQGYIAEERMVQTSSQTTR